MVQVVKSSDLRIIEYHKRSTIKKAKEFLEKSPTYKKPLYDMKNEEIDCDKIIKTKLEELESINLTEDNVLQIRDLLKYIDSFIIYK